MVLERLKSTPWPEIFFMTVISGLVYLPQLGQMTFSKLDDWYFVYDALVQGQQAFVDLTLHTRPLRAPLYQLYYTLFGLQPLPYHLTMYLWRLIGGLGALWLFSLLWPKQRQSNFFAALLFTIFPGLTWWIAGLAFQPYVVSICLMVFSFAFTLKAMEAGSSWKRLLWMSSAILSGWVYLGLVEFFIGMEVFRLLCVYLFIRHSDRQASFLKTGIKAISVSMPYFLIPVGFVIWYQFFFDNWRKAQDAGSQLGRLLGSPNTIFWWLLHTIESMLNVTLLAWAIPFSHHFLDGRLKDILTALFLACIAICFVLLVDRVLTNDHEIQRDNGNDWEIEAVLIGLLGTLGGVLPIVLANRTATFEGYSHYTLAASLAGVVFIRGIVNSFAKHHIRLAALCTLVFLATWTQNSLSMKTAAEQKSLGRFWWEVSWRAPSILPGTTLMAVYPDTDYLDNREYVWGPANMIYYPEKQNKSPVEVPLSALEMDSIELKNILMGAPDVQKNDIVISNTSMVLDYKNILILSQPSSDSCVHVLDSRWPALSIYDDSFVLGAAQKSKIENIMPSSTSPMQSKSLFGSEPTHKWCYYYQKADLARQQGDWKEVIKLEREAQELGYHPNDQIEWMPFLQAYALLGDQKKVKDVSSKINVEPFYKYQACHTMKTMGAFGYPLQPEMQAYIEELFCKGK